MMQLRTHSPISADTEDLSPIFANIACSPLPLAVLFRRPCQGRHLILVIHQLPYQCPCSSNWYPYLVMNHAMLRGRIRRMIVTT